MDNQPPKKTKLKRWLIILSLVLVGLPWGVGTYIDWKPRFGPSELGNVRNDTVRVSIIRLIASPENYEGKCVQVTGFLRIEFEGNALYLAETDYRHRIGKNGLWVDASDERLRELSNFSGHYVLIEGVFEPDDTGHMGAFSGAIRDVNRCRLVW
ncbi:MAG TPA: hypothetical protein VK178_07915 [Opitutaceae bacterium]|nr:hypothetical protein [Opitutaceae bacterium]